MTPDDETSLDVVDARLNEAEYALENLRRISDGLPMDGHSALGWLPPITRVPVVGPKVLPQESQDQTVEVTPNQLSIFDDLGGA